MRAETPSRTAAWVAAARGMGMLLRIARPRPTVRAIAKVVARAGEPWRWGWPPAELPGWLAARGFTVGRDVGIDAAARELLPATLAQRVGDPESLVAIALRESVALASSRGLS
jgi:hypothetical protein